MTISARARRDAAEQEDIAQQWRDWCAYLRAQLQLLEARTTQSSRVAFERDESWEDAERAAQANLAAMPVSRRILFDAVLAARRQEIQQQHELALRMNGNSRRMVDPDVVDRETLNALVNEAEGRASADGWGQTPLGTPEQPEWYRVDVAALNDAPSAALYALGQSAAVDRRRRLILLAGLIAACTLLLAIWLIWPATPAQPPHTQFAPALVEGVPVTQVWQPQTIILRASDTEIASLPVLPASATTTAETLTQPGAIWRDAMVYPLSFCLPAALLQQSTEALVISSDGVPERRYRLSDERAGNSDLVLESCDQEKDAAIPRYGQLVETSAPVDAAIGERQQLTSATWLTVRAIELTGTGEDPALPAGQARLRVTVEVTGDAPALDWPALAPTLLLASGTALLPGTIEQQPDGVVLTYLAPAPEATGALLWMVTPPANDRVLRWRATIAPPPDRDRALYESLVVEQVLAAPETAASVLITLRIVNQGNIPVTLTPADFMLARADTPISLPAMTGLTEPLPPGAQRDLAFTLPLSTLSQPLTLAIGSRQFRLDQEP